MKSSVIVIGASGGIGGGVVANLLAEGYPVVAVGRYRDTLLQLADRLGQPSALTVLTASVESETASRQRAKFSDGLPPAIAKSPPT